MRVEESATDRMESSNFMILILFINQKAIASISFLSIFEFLCRLVFECFD